MRRAATAPTAIDDLRLIQQRAWDTGHATGQIDGEAKERGRVVALVRHHLDITSEHSTSGKLLADIESGKDPR